MPDVIDGDCLRPMIDLIEDAVIADSKAIRAFRSGQFKRQRRMWVSLKAQGFFQDDISNMSGDFAEVLLDVFIKQELKGLHSCYLLDLMRRMNAEASIFGFSLREAIT